MPISSCQTDKLQGTSDGEALKLQRAPLQHNKEAVKLQGHTVFGALALTRLLGVSVFGALACLAARLASRLLFLFLFWRCCVRAAFLLDHHQFRVRGWGRLLGSFALNFLLWQ